MWRRTLALLLSLSLLCAPLWAGSSAGARAPDPATMTDAQILDEISAISERQRTRLENLLEELPKARLTLQTSQRTLDESALRLEKLQRDLTDASASLKALSLTVTGSTSSLESFIGDMEKENRKLRILNGVLVGTTVAVAVTAVVCLFVAPAR